jgi:hypothetical protein
MNSMAAFTSTSVPIPVSASSGSAVRLRPNRRRITPQAGRALEILGHAIEYLTDEFVFEGGSFSANNEQLKAVQLLMALNRQVYYECPELPSLRERLRAWLRL